jgi:hypothetical protein
MVAAAGRHAERVSARPPAISPGAEAIAGRPSRSLADRRRRMQSPSARTILPIIQDILTAK